MNEMMNDSLCICGSAIEKADCCLKYINGVEVAPTPEALMRSRFVAFATSAVFYILATEELSVPNTIADLSEWCKMTNWTKLEVINHSESSDIGMVHFRAHYTYQGSENTLEEVSDFSNKEGKWIYIGGKVK